MAITLNGSTGISSAGNVLSAGNVTAGNILANNYYFGNGVPFSGGGNGTPGGSNTQIQFNDAGAFGGDGDLTYNKNTNTLALNGTLTALDATVYGAVSSVTVGASGNIVGGNLNTGGVVSATGNVRGSNINTAGIVSATGNITGGNINTAGIVSVTGNVRGGNINTAGIVSATGNVTGNYFIGNGSQLTGIVASAGNALINGGNSFALQSDGNVVFQGSVPGQGVNRGMVWDFGANANGVNSEVRQDVSGLTVRAWTENSGNYAASVNIVTNQNANEKEWIFNGEGNLILPGNLKLAAGNIESGTGAPAFNSGITGITSGSANVIITIADEIFEGSFSGQVTISGVNPPVQANGDWWYESVDIDQFQLFTDSSLTTPVDGTDWPGYVDGGTATGVGTYSNLTIQGGNVSITSNDRIWVFDTTGNLRIPNDIISNTTIDIDNRLSGNTADIRLYSADDIVLQGRDRSAGSGTEGGDINIYAGDSAEDGDASGGDIQIFAGDGGAANVDFGGQGGFITIRAGQGGSAIGDGVSVAESGGSLTLEAGDAGGNNGNINRGADGGDVYINAGESTGNLAAGGDIVLTTGPGGSNAPAGNVRIIIPSSDLGSGGTWTFNHTGNLTLPNNGNVNGADGQFVRVQSLEEGVVRSGMILNPGDGLTRLESWDNQNSQGFTSADWSSAQYVDGGPAGQIAFVNAPSILNLVNSVETSRLFLQVNGGSFMPYQGYGSSGNNITFDVLTAPATSPETVTSFTMAWSTRSRIEMDYDEGELNITARDLDININGDQDVDIQSSYRIRMENSSNVNGIYISTDTANTFRTWTFNVDGSLSLPSGANIANGALNGGTASATVALNAFSPDGNTVSIQAQGNTSSAVISIFANSGPVTNNWTFTQAPLDPTEAFLYVPPGGAISTPNATGGEGGKNIRILAGTSDPDIWNSNPGGELYIQGGYGSFGDGGGGAGGNVNINGGESSDSHAGNVNITAGAFRYWSFDYTGNLNLPPSGNIVGLTANNSGYLNWVGNSSGDGAGYTTMQLVPDDTRTGGDQYLIIDPTAPGHIHIRAGGTQDNSGADLILGGENSYVKVSAGPNPPVYVSANSNVWTFTTDGVFQAPGDISASGNIIGGNISATSTMQLAVYANATVRDSSITSPTPGMMIYVTGTGMQVRGATQWNTVTGTGT